MIGRLAAAALTLALFAAPPAAALVVFDPANYAQNVLQAARALEQIQNEVQALQNQALMLANEGRNLAPLSYSAMPALRADMARITALLRQAEGLANDVAGLKAELDRNYPLGGAAPSDAALAASAHERWRNSAEGFRRVLAVQALVLSTAESTQSQVSALAEHSQSAAGALEAAQSGNQLLALQAKQLSDLTAILAVQARAQALEDARRAQAAADARARLDRFLGRAP